jgi:hypothetical protein
MPTAGLMNGRPIHFRMPESAQHMYFSQATVVQPRYASALLVAGMIAASASPNPQSLRSHIARTHKLALRRPMGATQVVHWWAHLRRLPCRPELQTTMPKIPAVSHENRWRAADGRRGMDRRTNCTIQNSPRPAMENIA